MNTAIQAKNLTKRYHGKTVVDGINFSVERGRILGLIGPNGSGKTTTLKSMLGLIPFEGDMRVLGFDPRTQRDAMMADVCFIADVSVLPRWMRVQEVVDFADGVHPRFDRDKAMRYLRQTKITHKMLVKHMSKGMIAQLHLAIVMAIDARLLVLDEPTLGLDILYRKQFYKGLVEDYFDENKTIVITTHQAEEIEHLMTDVIFIQDGNVTLSDTMEAVRQRFVEVTVPPQHLEGARSLKPVCERQVFGKSIFLFDGVGRDQFVHIGETKNPNITDIFVAMMNGVYT